MTTRILRFILPLIVLQLLFLSLSMAQMTDKRPNYPDEIVPIKGKPFKGKILKFEGSTLYVEITKHKVTQIITLDVDSLQEVTKDFGPTKIIVWKRKAEARQSRPVAASPIIKLPKNYAITVKRDTVAALAVERDSIYVGAVDRQDTTAQQASFVDQKPVPLVRANTDYPAGAVSRRMEGIVRLRLWIDKEGLPRKHEVVESTDPIFLESAVTSAMKWEFSPAVVKGTPIGVWASITFEYKFQK